MSDIKIPLIFLLLSLIVTLSFMVLDHHLNNKMRTEILIACIQSDNCSDSMKKELKPVK